MNEEVQILKRQIENQSPKIVSFLTDNYWVGAAREVSKKYKLSDSQTPKFINEIMFVVLGFENKKNFVKNIIRNVGIDPQSAYSIADEIQEKIFTFIEDYLPKESDAVRDPFTTPTQLKARVNEQPPTYNLQQETGRGSTQGSTFPNSQGRTFGPQNLGGPEEIFSQNLTGKQVYPPKISTGNLGGQAQSPRIPEEYHQELKSGNTRQNFAPPEKIFDKNLTGRQNLGGPEKVFDGNLTGKQAKSELEKKLEQNPNVMKSGYSGVDPYREPTE